MSTNIPSFQNGRPHPIDNQSSPQGLSVKQQAPFKIMTVTGSSGYGGDPRTLEEALNNIRKSLSGI